VRSFLGLCSYYRKFIRRFAIKAHPLTRLTRNGCDVETESQSDECQAAIEALKAGHFKVLQVCPGLIALGRRGILRFYKFFFRYFKL